MICTESQGVPPSPLPPQIQKFLSLMDLESGRPSRPFQETVIKWLTRKIFSVKELRVFFGASRLRDR